MKKRGWNAGTHPADLTDHTIPGVHTDGELDYGIRRGLPRTAMATYESLLDETRRWDVANYIRAMAQRVK